MGWKSWAEPFASRGLVAEYPPSGAAYRLQRFGFMRAELTDRIRKHAGESDFANRLIEIATQIEQDFRGEEQERLLELVRETLDRHVEIRDNTQRARVALQRLQADQQALLQLFDFIVDRPGGRWG